MGISSIPEDCSKEKIGNHSGGGVDVNLGSIAYAILDMDGRLVAMETLLFRGLIRALHLKHIIEDLRRHPRNLRRLKWTRRVMSRWNKRVRSKLDNACRCIAKKIVSIAMSTTL